MPGGVPLPGTGPQVTPPVPGLLGVWRGTVVTVDPVQVQVPRLSGDQLRPVDEYALLDPPLAAGDRVWLLPIEGDRSNLAVIARRA